jgi:hypothetical protein
VNDKFQKVLPYYTPGQIALACALGSPVASGWLIAVTCRGAGEGKKGQLALILGIVVTVILIRVGFILPPKTPEMPLSALVLIIVFHTTKHFLNPVIESRVANGAVKGSWWMAIGIGLLGMIVVVAVVVGIIFL